MKPAYRINDIVYHAVDEDPGIVTAVIERENGYTYEVTWPGRCVDTHSAGELGYERQYHAGRSDDREASHK